MRKEKDAISRRFSILAGEVDASPKSPARMRHNSEARFENGNNDGDVRAVPQ